MKKIAAALLVALLALPIGHSVAQTGPSQSEATSQRPRVLLVRIWVTDLDRSEHFYRTVFGFGPAQAFGAGNRMFGAPSQTAPSIVLALTPEPRSNGSFALAVNDTAAVMAAVPNAGGSVANPAQQAHGLPIGFVTDPDGALIEVIQLPEAAP